MNKRKALIAQLMCNSGGYGFGVCSFGNSMLWAMDEPGPNNPDLISVVAICGDPSKYTDEELKVLVEFSKAATERYDKMFRIRRGCNLILLDKDEFDGKPTGSWMRKRLTWESGPMYSESLTEALDVFRRGWTPQEAANAGD